MVSNIQLNNIICNLIANNTNKSGRSNYVIIGHSLLANTYDGSHIESWCISHSPFTMEAIITGVLTEDSNLTDPAWEAQEQADTKFLQDLQTKLRTELQETILDNGIFLYTYPNSGWCIIIHQSDHGFYITECTALD